MTNNRTNGGAPGTGIGEPGDPSPTIAASHIPAIGFVAQPLGAHHARHNGDDNLVAHSLRGIGFDASEDGTGRGTPLVPVAFAQNSRDEIREIGGNIAGALSAQPGMKQQTYLAFKESQSGSRVSDVHATLDSNKGSRRMEGVISGFGVRRLTPLECERCQGMPDFWTKFGVTEDGKSVELSDSARYQLIGNSVAIPNVEWIAKRIVAA